MTNNSSNRRGRRAVAKNRIMNVRVTDPASGLDGVRVERTIAAVKESESQTRIVIGDAVDLPTSSTVEVSGSYSFDNIFATDDYASMIQQYNLFRIRYIKFDIIDVNSGAAVVNTWGTWHDNYEGTVPVYSRQNINDLPDARVMSAGTGQFTLYWAAHGVAENQFQAASTAGSPAQRFGGLKYFYSTSAVAGAKYVLNVHAVVDFRGRR